MKGILLAFLLVACGNDPGNTQALDGGADSGSAPDARAAADGAPTPDAGLALDGGGQLDAQPAADGTVTLGPWDGVYTLTWTETARTCQFPGGISYVRLAVELAQAKGTYTTALGSVMQVTASLPAADVLRLGGFVSGSTTVSGCDATQVAGGFTCTVTRTDGPPKSCGYTYQLAAVRQ